MHSKRWKVGTTIAAGACIWLAAVWTVGAVAPGGGRSRAQRGDVAREAVTSGAAAGQQAGGQAAGYVGQDTCLTCHADKEKVYKATPHGEAQDRRSPAAKQGCETCHGPGKAHVDAGGDKTKIRTFGPSMTPDEISGVCETCHNRGAHADWDGSMHERRRLTCTTCHSVHSFKSDTAQLKTTAAIDTCAACHRTEALKVRRIAHMPLREGKMDCSSCHNPHGSANVRLLRQGYSISEACTGCHAAQRGPFLWEHAPTRERCTTCHDPHGSSNDRMLVAKLPMLCQRCHVSTRHPSTIYDLSVLGTSSENRLINRGCVNCHQNIHGSNHPSGDFFLR